MPEDYKQNEKFLKFISLLNQINDLLSNELFITDIPLNLINSVNDLEILIVDIIVRSDIK